MPALCGGASCPWLTEPVGRCCGSAVSSLELGLPGWPNTGSAPQHFPAYLATPNKDGSCPYWKDLKQ